MATEPHPRQSAVAEREPIPSPRIHASQLRDAARIIRRYEGIFAYPQSLADHFERVADELDAERSGDAV